MFEKAREWNLSWELEYACRDAAFEAVSRLPENRRQKKFFLNVSPHIFSDERFTSGITMETLRQRNLNPENLVIEITETTSVDDYVRFEEIIKHYVSQGYNVALDDFGAGHSGLVTLVAMTPHYIKFDRALISEINRYPYKEKLLKSIIAFGAGVNISTIAEGIETLEELSTLTRLGVDYGQGFFFARPAPEPREIAPEVLETVISLSEEKKRRKYSFDMSISDMMGKTLSVPEDYMTCGELDSTFRKNHHLNHVVIVSDDRPVSMVTRQNFYSMLGGRYGYAIFQKKLVDSIAGKDPLCVREDIDLRSLSQQAMGRNYSDLYDPVVVVDAKGIFMGTITMKQVINRAFDMEIQIASCSNPLTMLPGNIMIGRWLEEIICRESYSILYCDLDYFKEYNDCYGFSRGDELLKFLSRHLAGFIDSIPGARLGHIGGDDFIIIHEGPVPADLISQLCCTFDEKRKPYFTPEHWSRGSYPAIDRQGDPVTVPLTCLSIAVLTEKNFRGTPHPGRIGQAAASLKKQVKAENRKKGKSGFLFDRREQAADEKFS
jgi:EAL domain-containing protein (putative c-di-GMP-specific phosphodiesterase class I)/GGDEF domain-containing protein